MGNGDRWFVINGHCDEAVLFDGCRQDTVALIVDVFANDIDPSWSPGYKLRLLFVEQFELVQQLMIARSVGRGVQFRNMGVGQFWEHCELY